MSATAAAIAARGGARPSAADRPPLVPDRADRARALPAARTIASRILERPGDRLLEEDRNAGLERGDRRVAMRARGASRPRPRRAAPAAISSSGVAKTGRRPAPASSAARRASRSTTPAISAPPIAVSERRRARRRPSPRRRSRPSCRRRSARAPAAVDHEVHARDERRLVAREQQRRARHVVRLAEPGIGVRDCQ